MTNSFQYTRKITNLFPGSFHEARQDFSCVNTEQDRPTKDFLGLNDAAPTEGPCELRRREDLLVDHEYLSKMLREGLTIPTTPLHPNTLPLHDTLWPTLRSSQTHSSLGRYENWCQRGREDSVGSVQRANQHATAGGADRSRGSFLFAPSVGFPGLGMSGFVYLWLYLSMTKAPPTA